MFLCNRSGGETTLRCRPNFSNGAYRRIWRRRQQFAHEHAKTPWRVVLCSSFVICIFVILLLIYLFFYVLPSILSVYSYLFEFRKHLLGYYQHLKTTEIAFITGTRRAYCIQWGLPELLTPSFTKTECYECLPTKLSSTFKLYV